MKYKTLFRLMLKAIGILIFAEGTRQVFPMIVSLVYELSRSGPTGIGGPGRLELYAYLNMAGALAPTVFGLYLFFGGKWIVDKAIPSNRPYCQECGYDLTGATRDRCPECDTPFRPEDVMPRQRKDDTEATIHREEA